MQQIAVDLGIRFCDLGVVIMLPLMELTEGNEYGSYLAKVCYIGPLVEIAGVQVKHLTVSPVNSCEGQFLAKFD